MAEQDNLIPFSKRSKEEARELGRKGGIASGKVRRKKANLKRAMETILKMDVPDSNLKDLLTSMGLDPSMEQGLVLSVLLNTMKRGGAKDLSEINRILQQDTTLADRREQKARTERMQAETKRVETELAIKTGEDGQELANEQQQAIADLINTPESERVLSDFLGPRPEEVEDAADTDGNTSEAEES